LTANVNICGGFGRRFVVCCRLSFLPVLVRASVNRGSRSVRSNEPERIGWGAGQRSSTRPSDYDKWFAI
jgi:hypothetical protein